MGQTGLILAELLELPFAALAVAIEIKGAKAVVHRELESNTLEVVELGLPALITVQTGINQPRYVSIMGIRKVRRIPIAERDADDLDLNDDDIGKTASSVADKVLALPERAGGAEMVEGSLDEMGERAAEIIRDSLS